MNRYGVAIAFAIGAGFCGYAGHEVAAFWLAVGAFIIVMD